MKKTISFLIFALSCAVSVMAVNDNILKYDIHGAGSGIEGTILVKVYVYGKKVSDSDLKSAAVHGVVFRGCEGNESGAYQPPMTSPVAETEHASFCDAFFSADGDCQNYASIVDGSYERIKTKKGYKVGAILQVDKVSLRKYLEKAGLVKSLSTGF
ncbi:MAG: hypothetical protein IKJ97_07745 [Bacteroidaceae bacterium]|nr:hypothetical protein [Bacteroidaceae bacterium]